MQQEVLTGPAIGDTLKTSIIDSGGDPQGGTLPETSYLSLIGGAIFSAGAGGKTGFAPAFCASRSGRAGSGAGVVGRSPPGFDSAGALS